MIGCDAGGYMMSNNMILDVNINSFQFQSSNPKQYFKKNHNNHISILSDIQFQINQGNVISIVGDSGCGKTTLGKILVNYFNTNNDAHAINGSVDYYYKDRYCVGSKKYNKDFPVPPIQMIFQDPKTSINLKMTVRSLIEESLKLSSKNNNVNEQLLNITNQLLIDEKLLDKTAKNLSGGQRRRVGIAKIIAGLSTLPDDVPKIIIADEPVASLDASIKHEIMKCLGQE